MLARCRLDRTRGDLYLATVGIIAEEARLPEQRLRRQIYTLFLGMIHKASMGKSPFCLHLVFLIHLIVICLNIGEVDSRELLSC